MNIDPRAVLSRLGMLDRRTAPRTGGTAIECNLGTIVDLSAVGLRIRSRQSLRGRVDLEVCDGHEMLRLRAEVMWSRRRGLRTFEAGLRFSGLSHEQTSRLQDLAMTLRHGRFDYADAA